MIKPLMTTGIGSLPHRDPTAAIELILKSCDIPFWPQLPERSFLEGMIPQYAEGLPGLVVDETRQRVFVRHSPEEITAFYEKTSEDGEFPISTDYAVGLSMFLEITEGRNFPIIKGQITGPLTFTLGLKLQDGRTIYADEELREIGLLLLQAKARWQMERLSSRAEGVIIFIDEPILSAIGSSSYLGVSEEETLRMLSGTVEAIHSAGGISGIHCCGRADWGMVIRSGIKVLNFDAFDFFESLTAYREDLSRFLSGGGFIAWGIVPTTEAINEVSPVGLRDAFLSQVEKLSSLTGCQDLPEHIILTPSCGAGSRTVEEAERVFSILRALKEELKA